MCPLSAAMWSGVYPSCNKAQQGSVPGMGRYWVHGQVQPQSTTGQEPNQVVRIHGWSDEVYIYEVPRRILVRSRRPFGRELVPAGCEHDPAVADMLYIMPFFQKQLHPSCNPHRHMTAPLPPDTEPAIPLKT